MEILGFIGLGFGLGVIACYFMTWKEKRDLVDRITWHDPADFLLMKYNREQAEKSKPSFSWLPIKPLTKKVVTQEEKENQIANKISSVEEKEKLIADYLEKKRAIDEDRKIETEEQANKEMALNGIPRA